MQNAIHHSGLRQGIFRNIRRVVLTFFAISGLAQIGRAQAPDAAATVLNSNDEGAVFAMTNRARNNEVVTFKRASNGTLRETHRYSTEGNGIGVDFDTQDGLTLSSDHRFLYACNPGSDNVTVFAVDGDALTLIQKVYAGDQPLSIALSGNLAYLLDGSVAGNGITGFTVRANGRLSPIPDSFRALSSPIAVPGDVKFSPDGRTIVVTGKVGSILDVFQVRASGLLSRAVQNQSFGPRPFAEAFRNDGRLLVFESGLPIENNAAVSSYNLDRPSSQLSVITGSEHNGQTDGCWIVITEDQQYAYTANFASGTISSYELRSDGSVNLLKGGAAFLGRDSQPTDLALSTGSVYLYNLLRGTGGVAGFRVRPDGGLDPLGIFGVGRALPIADGASGLAAY